MVTVPFDFKGVSVNVSKTIFLPTTGSCILVQASKNLAWPKLVRYEYPYFDTRTAVFVHRVASIIKHDGRTARALYGQFARSNASFLVFTYFSISLTMRPFSCRANHDCEAKVPVPSSQASNYQSMLTAHDSRSLYNKGDSHATTHFLIIQCAPLYSRLKRKKVPLWSGRHSCSRTILAYT